MVAQLLVYKLVGEASALTQRVRLKILCHSFPTIVTHRAAGSSKSRAYSSSSYGSYPKQGMLFSSRHSVHGLPAYVVISAEPPYCGPLV
jgi:hypothetical protein